VQDLFLVPFDQGFEIRDSFPHFSLLVGFCVQVLVVCSGKQHHVLEHGIGVRQFFLVQINQQFRPFSRVQKRTLTHLNQQAHKHHQQHGSKLKGRIIAQPNSERTYEEFSANEH
jgi:hypothetical protein